MFKIYLHALIYFFIKSWTRLIIQESETTKNNTPAGGVSSIFMIIQQRRTGVYNYISISKINYPDKTFLKTTFENVFFRHGNKPVVFEELFSKSCWKHS